MVFPILIIFEQVLQNIILAHNTIKCNAVVATNTLTEEILKVFMITYYNYDEVH